MKNTDKMSEFDNQWKEAFGDAEMAPSEGVWDRIDSSLSKQEAGYFKKRASVFKLLAAASIIFALGVSLFSINYFIDQEFEPVAIESIIKDSDASETNLAPPISELNSEKPSNTVFGNGRANLDQKPDLLVSNDVKETKQITKSSVIADSGSNAEKDKTYISTSDEYDRNRYVFKELAGQGIGVQSNDLDMYEIDHIYLIPIMPKGASRKSKKPVNNVFLAGLDFSTGIFDPNFQQGGNAFANASGSTFANARVESVNDQLTSFNATNKDFLLVRSAGQETKPEVEYNYGANFGFRISRRILLQSGIAYRKANTTTTTRGYFEDPVNNTQIPIVASYQYQLDGLSAVKRTAETDLNNQYEFASIPLRAGYVFLDRKINLTFMAGISSELFLNNRIGSNSTEFETLTTTSGDGSPYKRVYFNGSLGTMMGYTFAKNYQISVEPSYRFAMNSFTREDFYLNSYPSSFMVSFGVAYNFR